MSAGDHLVIIGASARAAAFSALRAGLRPWCADLFADLDLQARCPVRAIPAAEYPEGFVDIVKEAPSGPVLFTGGLENRPELLDRFDRPKWGITGVGLSRFVRSPGRVRDALRGGGLPFLDVREEASPELRDRRWLLKPLRGAGGAGIRFWDGEAPFSGGTYLQQYVEGESCAALYLGDGLNACLLGVTRQLVGLRWLHAKPFHYCGSIGPLPLSSRLRRTLVQVGDVLADQFDLRGLFGVDCVVRDGVPYLVEVNPRYTASVEVLEHATGRATLDWLRRLFEPPYDMPAIPSIRNTGTVLGKAILFAPHELTFPHDGPWMSALRQPKPVEELPDFADIPAAGHIIPAGRPILTFFCARAGNLAACREQLQATAADLDHWLKRKAENPQ